MCKAVLLFCLVCGVFACGSPPKEKGADRLDLSDPRTVPEIGKVLYLRHCVQCHADVRSDDNRLADRIHEAQGDFAELQKFVRNQDSLLKAGDPYTLEVNEKWGGQTYRHSFTLTDAELKALFYYLETTF